MKFYHLIKAKDVDINVDRSNRGDDKVDFIFTFSNPYHTIPQQIKTTLTYDREFVNNNIETVRKDIEKMKALLRLSIQQYCEWLYAEEKEFNLKTYEEFISIKAAQSTPLDKKGRKKTT